MNEFLNISMSMDPSVLASQVIYALLSLGDLAAEEGIMESGVAIRCLDLFTQFPFNNLLHHRVRPKQMLLAMGARCYPESVALCSAVLVWDIRRPFGTLLLKVC